MFFLRFCYRDRSPYGTVGRTDRQTDGQDPYCGLLGRPNCKCGCF